MPSCPKHILKHSFSLGHHSDYLSVLLCLLFEHLTPLSTASPVKTAPLCFQKHNTLEIFVKWVSTRKQSDMVKKKKAQDIYSDDLSANFTVYHLCDIREIHFPTIK